MEKHFGQLRAHLAAGTADDDGFVSIAGSNRVCFAAGPFIKCVDLRNGDVIYTIRSAGGTPSCITATEDTEGTLKVVYAADDLDGQPIIHVVTLRGNEEQDVNLNRDGETAVARYESISFSHDGRYLITVETALQHHVIVWDATQSPPVEVERSVLARDEHVHDKILNNHNGRMHIITNPDCAQEFAVTTPTTLTIFELEFCASVVALTTRPVPLRASRRGQRRNSLLNKRSSVAEMLNLDQFLEKDRVVTIAAAAWGVTIDDPDDRTSALHVGSTDGVFYKVQFDSARANEIRQYRTNLDDIGAMAIFNGRLVHSLASSVTSIDLGATDASASALKTALPAPPHTLCVTGDGMHLVTCGRGYIATLNKEGELQVIQQTFRAGEVSGVGMVRPTAAEDVPIVIETTGTVHILHADTGHTLDTIDLGITDITTTACSPATGLVVAGDGCGTLSALALAATTSQCKHLVCSSIASGAITHLSVDECGTTIVAACVDAGSNQRRVVVLRVGNGMPIVGHMLVPPTIDRVRDMAATVDGSGAVTCTVLGECIADAQAYLFSFVLPLDLLGSGRGPEFPLDGEALHQRTVRLNRRLSRVQSLAVANDADGQPCAYVYCASADVAAVPLSETTAAVPWEDSADATDTDASPAPYHDVPGHIFGTECRCVSVAGGQLVASVGNDGVVLARATADGACLAQPAVGMGHSDSSLTLAPPPLQNVQDSTSCHIAAGIDGQSFITSTRHGREVLLWKWDSAPQDDVATAVVAAAMTVLASTPCTRARHALAAATPSASVATPDPTTTTVVRGPTTSTDARGMAVATRSRTEARQREALAGRVARVREKVTALIESNETKDALERLERDEFQLDLAERQRLVAEGDVQLRALREEIDLKILAQQFLRWRIKKMCWDSMRVRGTCVFTFNQQLEVSNYPLPKRSKAELTELKYINFARKVQDNVAQRIKQVRRRSAGTLSVQIDANPAVPAQPSDTAGGRDAGGADGDGATIDASAAGEAGEEEGAEGDFYDQIHLHSNIKKRAEIMLIRNRIVVLKEAFNTRHDEVCSDKRADMKKIQDINDKIRKVLDELNRGRDDGAEPLTHTFFTPTLHALETPDVLLTVADEEVRVPRVLNAAEREQQAVEDRKAEDLRRLAAMDNPRERGLQVMMDGRLEGKGDEEVWLDVPQPTFMTEVAAAAWSDAQKYKAEEYANAVKERAEMRGKRIQALHSELSDLQTAADTTRTAFDDRVLSLFNDKISTQQNILQEELKMVLLMRGLQRHNALLLDETQLMREARDGKAIRTQCSRKRQDSAAIVHDAERAYQKLERADKALEKAFKTKMRENADTEPHVDALTKLYKQRSRHTRLSLQLTVAHGTTPEDPPMEPELNKTTDCPDGVSDASWESLVHLREKKIASEHELAMKAHALADMQTFLRRRTQEEDDRIDRAGAIVEELKVCRDERLDHEVNVEILVPIKQGSLEVQHTNDFEPEYSLARLIPASVIHDLNGQILQLGQVRVEHMASIMELKKAIHMLAWQHEHFDMLAADLAAQLKAVQLMRVTRDISLNKGGETREERNRKENEVLEKTMDKLKGAMARAVAQKKKAIHELQRQAEKYAEDSGDIAPEVDSLEVAVEEHATIHDVYVANQGPNRVHQRLRSMAQRRKLVNMVKAQQQEISALQKELHTWRMKSFPAFHPGERSAF